MAGIAAVAFATTVGALGFAPAAAATPNGPGHNDGAPVMEEQPSVTCGAMHYPMCGPYPDPLREHRISGGMM